MTTTVVNIKSPVPFNARGEPNYVYVGRPSKWGNPFVLEFEGERDEVLEKYRAWLAQRPDLIAAARRDLAGKVLGCFCHPKACHAHVLARVADGGEP